MIVNNGDIVRVYSPWYYRILNLREPTKNEEVGRVAYVFNGMFELTGATGTRVTGDYRVLKQGISTDIKVERLV